jgi:predicted nucleic acid-binding protein
MILCDAGVILCLVDRTQPKHHGYKKQVLQLNKPLITTWSCLTEAMYLAYRRGGWAIQHQLGQMLLDQTLVVYEIQQDAHNRILELMARYQDRPMDLADATLVLTAEKTGRRKILTLDSDFLFYRIGDNLDNFEVIQVDG